MWAMGDCFLAYALRPQVRSRLLVHQALRRLGDLLMGQGADDTALSVLMVALEGFTQMDVHQSRAECMQAMGNVYRKEVARIDEKLQMLGAAQKLQEVPKITFANFPGHFAKVWCGQRRTEPSLIPDL
ncbi:hypothetical protein B0H14DRAFT_2621750 [Mycena olivaceomarginata]|nr:hypothetical protein B0H14DRAFT_2621750 [Mycena olivaceomarginata]